MTAPVHPVRVLPPGRADRPYIVIWEVTRACQLACTHCRADAVRRRNPGELDTDEARRLLDDLAAVDPPRPIVVLTGGDPLERRDLATLVAHGTAAGLNMSLAPSVTPRLTAEALAELRSAGAKAVALSIDGATSGTHDGFRGVAGVFDATVTAAAVVSELGFRLQVNSTVTAKNVLELPGILATAITVRASLWSVFFLVPTGRGTTLDGLSAQQTEDVLHWLHDISGHIAVKATEAPHFRRIALQRAEATHPETTFAPGPLRTWLREETTSRLGATQGRRPSRPPLDVNAGRGFLFIDHLGRVYPSGFLPIIAGSVRDQPVTEIYRTSPLLRSLRDPTLLGGRCGRCEFQGLCGGSRSQAFAATGNALAEDPRCVYQPEWPPPGQASPPAAALRGNATDTTGSHQTSPPRKR